MVRYGWERVNKELCYVSRTCVTITPMCYTVITLPYHVAHSTAQNGCDDTCSILDYNLHGPTAFSLVHALTPAFK